MPTYIQKEWSLNDLFPAQESPKLEDAFKDLEVQVAEFETRRDELTESISMDEFMDIVSQYEAINHLAHRMYGFASLRFAADTQDQTILTFMGRVDQFLTGLQNRTLFFNLWWKSLEDENADRLMSGGRNWTPLCRLLATRS